MKQTIKTANHSLIYGLGIVIQHVTSLVMLPIYTRFLSPEDYGVADLMAMGVEVISLLVSVISADVIFRFYYDQDDDDYKHRVIFTIFLLSAAMNLIGYSVIYFTADYSANYLFNEMEGILNGVMLVKLYGLTILLQVCVAIPMAYVRAQQKPQLFVIFSIIRLVLAVACNVYFVVYKELHIEGVVYAVVSFTAIHASIMLIYMFSKVGVKFSRKLARHAMTFSLPLMAASLAVFLSTYADRLFIKHYVGVYELGLYALAYKFGFILVAFTWVPFTQSWDAERFKIAKGPDAIPIFQSVFRMTQALVIFVALAFAVMAQDILRIMAAPEFHAAHKLVAIIVFAYVLNIWSTYCMFGILYAKKTMYKTYADWICLGVVILLYILMIPRWGTIGACWATFFGFLLRFLLMNYWGNRCYPMYLEWPRVGGGFIAALLVYFASTFIALPVATSIFVRLCILFGFLVYPLWRYMLTTDDRALIFSRGRSLRQKFSS